MDHATHVLLATRLIEACGGVDAVVTSGDCHLRTSRLYDFRNENTGAVMDARTINELEHLCGEPVYSRALAEDRPSKVEAGSLMTEATELAAVTAGFALMVSQAEADGALTQAERRLLCNTLLRIEDEARQARTAFEIRVAA